MPKIRWPGVRVFIFVLFISSTFSRLDAFECTSVLDTVEQKREKVLVLKAKGLSDHLNYIEYNCLNFLVKDLAKVKVIGLLTRPEARTILKKLKEFERDKIWGQSSRENAGDSDLSPQLRLGQCKTLGRFMLFQQQQLAIHEYREGHHGAYAKRNKVQEKIRKEAVKKLKKELAEDFKLAKQSVQQANKECQAKYVEQMAKLKQLQKSGGALAMNLSPVNPGPK